MKAYFSEEQKRIIEESLNLENSAKSLPSHILTDLESSPLSKSPAFIDGFLKRACAKRYQQVKSEFVDDIESYDINTVLAKLSKLTIKCIKKEEQLRPQLERICLDTVSEFLKVPQDGVQIECHLQNEIDSHTQFHIKPDTEEEIEYDNLGQIEGQDSDTQKRYLLNAIIMGASMSLSEDIRHKALNKIFELDEELPHLYSQIMKINDYLLFRANFKIEDNNHKQGGYTIVKMGSDITPTSIESYGVIFPILLMETIRGCMELFISHGLPDDVQIAREVINKADALENDPWNTRIGPVLWDYISNAIEDENYNISSFFMNLSSLDNTEFFNIMKELYANTRLGKAIIKKIADDSKYEDDYNDFQADIQRKQKDLIEDDYFSEEELDEAVYPEQFNIEYFKSLPSFNKRIQYCEAYLQRISSGSSRIVYKIDNNTVLKLAKNSKGIAQNEIEGRHDYYRDTIGCFAKVYDVDDNYLWIEMQLARKAKPSDFKRLTGYDFQTICYWIDYCKPDRYQKSNPLKSFFDSPEFEENYDEYGLLAELQEYIGNYDVPIGDLKRISSWGIVNDEDGEQLVLIDYGLTNDVFNNFYGR